MNSSAKMEPYVFPFVFSDNGRATVLPGWRRCYMSIGTIILIILIIALLGGFSGIGGGPFYGTGYYGGGGLGPIPPPPLIPLFLGRLYAPRQIRDPRPIFPPHHKTFPLHR